ncbi:MAG: hypothetical protein ABJP48_09650 [Erythrobacter sp.]
MRNNDKLISVFSVLLGAACLNVPSTLIAQNNNVQQSDGIACMARQLQDGPHVPQSMRGQAFRIITEEGAISGLEAKGYVRVACENADINLANRRDGYRDRICKLSAMGNEAVQAQIEQALGERAAVLIHCIEMT